MKKWLLPIGALISNTGGALPAFAEPVPVLEQSSSSNRGVRVLPPEPEKPSLPAPAPAPVPEPAKADAVAANPEPAKTKAQDAAKTAAELPAAQASVAPPARCNRAFADAQLTLADSRAFDQKLVDLLSAKPENLVIDVAEGFEPATPPERLQPWLAHVTAAGGTVKAQEISCTRGFGLGKLLGKLFGRREPIHSAITGYDAVLWYEKASSKVTQIQLSRTQ